MFKFAEKHINKAFFFKLLVSSIKVKKFLTFLSDIAWILYKKSRKFAIYKLEKYCLKFAHKTQAQS